MVELASVADVLQKGIKDKEQLEMAVKEAVRRYGERLVYCRLMKCDITDAGKKQLFIFPLQKNKAFPCPSRQHTEKFLGSFKHGTPVAETFLNMIE